MRRPGRVNRKPGFFFSGQPRFFLADQREAPRCCSLLFHRLVFPAGASAMRIADQREAHSLVGPARFLHPAADSPCFHTHSLWNSPAPVPFGVLNLKRALPSPCRSEEASLPKLSFRLEVAVAR